MILDGGAECLWHCHRPLSEVMLRQYSELLDRPWERLDEECRRYRQDLLHSSQPYQNRYDEDHSRVELLYTVSRKVGFGLEVVMPYQAELRPPLSKILKERKGNNKLHRRKENEDENEHQI